MRLRFEGGRVVAPRPRAERIPPLAARDGRRRRRLGELAFGLNYEIDRFTRNILFDEKIGGTIHVALGSTFRSLGGQNESVLHWDLVCDLRADGEVFADGELVWRAGRFLGQPDPRSRVSERLRRFAEVLVGYSAGVQPGDLVVIQGPATWRPLLASSTPGPARAAASRRCEVTLELEDPCALGRQRRAGLDWVSPAVREDVERADVWIMVDRRATRRRSRGLPGAAGARPAARPELRERYLARALHGELKLGADRLPDPRGRPGRRDVARRVRGLPLRGGVPRRRRPGRPLAARSPTDDSRGQASSSATEELRIVAEGTDLTLAVGGRTWVPRRAGRTSPTARSSPHRIETSVDGDDPLHLPGGLPAGARSTT